MAVVYSRLNDDSVLTITPSGWTYGEDRDQSLFVLLDKETETLWYPMDRDEESGLVGIAGPLRDDFLPEITGLERTTWRDWKQRHPNTVFVEEG